MLFQSIDDLLFLDFSHCECMLVSAGKGECEDFGYGVLGEKDLFAAIGFYFFHFRHEIFRGVMQAYVRRFAKV